MPCVPKCYAPFDLETGHRSRPDKPDALAKRPQAVPIMLTRLEASGFKNLVDFALDFGPYTCIAGPNGVGKSNIFDAIRFLSLLTEHTMNDAALRVRSEESGDLADVFFATKDERQDRFQLAVEMIVPRDVSDDFGRPAKSTSTFLRYAVGFRYQEPSTAIGPFGGLVLEREELRHITVGHARNRLRFPHHKANFRDRVVFNKRFSGPYIDTNKEGAQEVVLVHQDGGSRGRGQRAPAAGAVRTIVGTENTTATPTILAARQEMHGWRALALEPSAMRRADPYTQVPGIAANGAHIPATLQHLGAADEQGLATIASRLSDLVPVNAVRVRQDDARQLLSLEVEERSGLCLATNSISDGTLRFLALAALAEGASGSGLFCMEEPENGIHPGNLKAMNLLLQDIAVDPHEPVGDDNPMRQVVVATHSPHFVQLQRSGDLVLARKVLRTHDRLGLVEPLVCQPCLGTWRSGKENPGVAEVALQSYLLPPENGRTPLQDDLWRSGGESGSS